MKASEKPTAPKDGYELPKWGQLGRYRATALAYMKRERETGVRNANGHRYTLQEIENAVSAHSITN